MSTLSSLIEIKLSYLSLKCFRLGALGTLIPKHDRGAWVKSPRHACPATPQLHNLMFEFGFRQEELDKFQDTLLGEREKGEKPRTESVKEKQNRGREAYKWGKRRKYSELKRRNITMSENGELRSFFLLAPSVLLQKRRSADTYSHLPHSCQSCNSTPCWLFKRSPTHAGKGARLRSGMLTAKERH